MGGRFVLGTTNSPYMLPGVTKQTFHISVGGDFSGSLLGAVTNSTKTNSHNTNTNSHNTGVGAGTVRASKAGSFSRSFQPQKAEARQYAFENGAPLLLKQASSKP
jgi:hypothetical protein